MSNLTVLPATASVRTLLFVSVLAVIAAVSGNTLFAAESSAAMRFSFKTDAGKSTIKFKSSAPLEDIEGSADAITGYLNFQPANVDASAGKVETAVAEMRTGISKRDKHMTGSDWLDAEAHPNIVYELKKLHSVEVQEQNGDRTVYKAVAVGSFTLHGVTKELSSPVTLTHIPESDKTRERAPGDFILVKTAFSIALADFNIKGVRGMVGSKVGESIELDVSLIGSVAQQ